MEKKSGGSPILHCLFVHTEPSNSGVKTPQYVIYTTSWRCGSIRGVMVSVMMEMSVCPPLNLNMYLPNVYHHIYAVILCCDWDPDLPCILESDKVPFFALSNIITSIGRCLTLTRGEGGCFLGESSLKFRSGREWPLKWFFQDSDYNNTEVKETNTWWVKSFSLGTDAVFQAEMWWKVGGTDRRTDRRTDTSPRITAVFFFLI